MTWNSPPSSARGLTRSACRWTSTIYKLEFLPSARKEWDRLNGSVRKQFAQKLKERLVHPRVTSARLGGLPDCYKIKLRKAGYRLIYRMEDERVTIVVIAVGRRDRNLVYKAAAGRLD